jgi:hypothetical protein
MVCFWLIFLLVQATGPSAVDFPFGGNGTSHELAAQFVPMALASGVAINFGDGNTNPAREDLLKRVVKGCNLYGLRDGYDTLVKGFPIEMAKLFKSQLTLMSTFDQVLLLCMCTLGVVDRV